MADEVKPAKPNPAERFGGKAGPGRTPSKHLGRTYYVKASQQLIDMRKVYKTEKPGGNFPSDTPGQAMCRKLWRENPKDFLQLLNKLEEVYSLKCERFKAKQEASEQAGAKDGKELCEMIDKLVAEWESTNVGTGRDGAKAVKGAAKRVKRGDDKAK